jgi:hypothetical protein
MSINYRASPEEIRAELIVRPEALSEIIVGLAARIASLEDALLDPENTPREASPDPWPGRQARFRERARAMEHDLRERGLLPGR